MADSASATAATPRRLCRRRFQRRAPGDPIHQGSGAGRDGQGPPERAGRIPRSLGVGPKAPPPAPLHPSTPAKAGRS